MHTCVVKAVFLLFCQVKHVVDQGGRQIMLNLVLLFGLCRRFVDSRCSRGWAQRSASETSDEDAEALPLPEVEAVHPPSVGVMAHRHFQVKRGCRQINQAFLFDVSGDVIDIMSMSL